MRDIHEVLASYDELDNKIHNDPRYQRLCTQQIQEQDEFFLRQIADRNRLELAIRRELLNGNG